MMDQMEPAIDELVPAQQVLTREFTKLSRPARALIHPAQTCGDYLETLVDEQLLEDALDFIGHALPLRHAIWWGCCCIAAVTPPETLEGKDRKAFAGTCRWVADPTDRRREYVHRVTRVVTDVTASILLARAAGYPNMKLPEPLAALKRNFKKEGVIAAVNIATLDGDDVDATRRQFLEIGLDVSRGKTVWHPPQN
ncbi:hypothetical protein Pan216_15150 [Planctomycetes bacterium Pan216]|uniref:Uncharacterized protein n=1 Tax=Kolteria novifilia TaxID=2527975 RepID=A0A518B129_9BACT|nr:hypothetical protein Pan216_15150 [Planctomycetes bacterium Pan216]